MTTRASGKFLNTKGAGATVTLAGLMTPVKSASLLATGQKIKFQQDRYRVSFTGLPEKAPDD